MQRVNYYFNNTLNIFIYARITIYKTHILFILYYIVYFIGTNYT